MSEKDKLNKKIKESGLIPGDLADSYSEDLEAFIEKKQKEEIKELRNEIIKKSGSNYQSDIGMIGFA